MNPQYEQLKVKQGEFIPQPALDYPTANPFERTLFPKYTKQLAIDDNSKPLNIILYNFISIC